jgi:hypothetical protein
MPAGFMPNLLQRIVTFKELALVKLINSSKELFLLHHHKV